jgi:hypothetical protein
MRTGEQVDGLSVHKARDKLASRAMTSVQVLPEALDCEACCCLNELTMNFYSTILHTQPIELKYRNKADTDLDHLFNIYKTRRSTSALNTEHGKRIQ